MSEVFLVRRPKPGEEGVFLADGDKYRFSPQGPHRISSEERQEKALRRKSQKGKSRRGFVILNAAVAAKK